MSSLANLAKPMNPFGFLNNAWSGTPAHQIGFAQNFNPMVQSQFAQFANNAQNYDITRSPLFQQAGNTFSSMMQPFDPSQFNQYFNQGVADPALQYYEQNILPRLKSQYYQPGAVQGSALNGAINQTAQNLQQGINQLRSNYLAQSQQQHEANRGQSAANALGLLQAGNRANLDYFSQLFGTRDVTPMIEQAQPGWLQEMIKTLIAAVGAATGAGTFDPFSSSSQVQLPGAAGGGAYAGSNYGMNQWQY